MNVNELTPSDLDFFMGEKINIETVNSSTVGSWKAKVGVQGKEISFKIDTGADVTVMGIGHLEQLGSLGQIFSPYLLRLLSQLMVLLCPLPWDGFRRP